MSEHHHNHDHADPGCCHDHDHDHALMVAEEPLDPANQSLADALRLSFKVLKWVMVGLVVVFLFSGVVIVDQKQVVVVSRFGKLVGEPRQPGLNFAWPYPIDELIPVDTSPRTLVVKSFWLNIAQADKTRSLSELNPRGNSLEPGVDGVLVTGDRLLMHMLLNVQYQVSNTLRSWKGRDPSGPQLSDAMLFVENVGDPEHTLQTAIQQAAVAEAGCTTADVIRGDRVQVANAIRERAQATLDELKSGIVLVKVVAEDSYWPLQARDDYLKVDQAMNERQQAINAAESDRTKKLLGAAGEAWKPIMREIELLDQQKDPKERAATIARIENLLTTQAKGDASGKIQVARKDQEKIVEDTRGEVARFNAVLEEYRRSPDLVRRRLQTRMLNELYADPDVIKWWMPAGSEQLMLLLNKDPEESLQAERNALKKTAGVK